MQRPAKSEECATDAAREAGFGPWHLLPGPATAPELAAQEATLNRPTSSFISLTQPSRARALVGTAAIAIAVTIPDVSFGAMGAAVMRIDMSDRVVELPDTIWIPAAQSPGPVYVPVIAAEQIAPSAVTYSSRSNFGAFDRVMPLEILESGSQRFDLAFAGSFTGVELPSLAILPPSARRRMPEGSPSLVAPEVALAANEPAPFAALVEVPQIGVALAGPSGTRSAPVEELVPPQGQSSFARVSEDRNDGAQGSSQAVAATNESLEAAFAGAIDVSGAVRSSIPVSGEARSAAPDASTPIDEVARAIPAAAPEAAPGVGAANESVLAGKTSLDARINGVLAGSVDFQQLDGTIAIRLRSVVNMLSDRFEASDLDRMLAGQSADAFVTLEQLQAIGVPISYNPAYDEVEFGIDYDDAPDAHKVQVQQIGSPTLGGSRALIDQIPR